MLHHGALNHLNLSTFCQVDLIKPEVTLECQSACFTALLASTRHLAC